MSGKACDKCGQPFKGFGSTCAPCRKGGSGGKATDCDKCGNFFIGHGMVCQDCVSGKGLGRTGVRNPTPEEVDKILDKIDSCIQKVDASQHSMVRLRKAEFDLLAQLEIARDIMQRIQKSGDRVLLRNTFIDCSRVARLGTMLGAIRLSDMNAGDQRLKNCEGTLDGLLELVQNDLGMQEQLIEANESAQSSLLMKRLSFLMDEEKVAEAHMVVDQTEIGQTPLTGDYVSAYSVSYGSHLPSAYNGTGYAGYPEFGGPGDFDDWDDYSDWDDEDADEMSEQEADQLFKSNARILFDELDVNGDGQLSKEEVLNGAARLSGLLKACRIHKRKQVIKMFKEGDIDNNGTLDFGEFMNYIQAAKQKSIENAPKKIDDAKVKKVFDLMDRDGDGTITREELKLAYAGVLLMAGETVDSKRISKWATRNFKKYDADGSGELDFTEFKKLLSHSGALAPMLDFADNMSTGNIL